MVKYVTQKEFRFYPLMLSIRWGSNKCILFSCSGCSNHCTI